MCLTAAAPVFAAGRTVMVVDDVIKMAHAGVGDEEIIAFVQKSREPFDVNADDVIAMTDAHVSRAVIRAVVDESAALRGNDRANDRANDRQDNSNVRRQTVYVAPAPYYSPYTSYYYDPYYYGYYDPFWYGPRVSLSFGFGHFFGGHFRHGRW